MILNSSVAGRDLSLRPIYLVLGLLMCGYVITGFAPSYYFKAVADSRALTPLVHVHGLLFSAWMILFVVQAALIGNRNYAAHRVLGMFGAGLAALMVLAGTKVAIDCSSNVACGAADPLRNYTLGLGDIAIFSIFVAAAIALRRKKEWHKRLMLLATVAIIDAAVSRWAIVRPLFAENLRAVDGLIVLWVITDLPVVAAIAADYAKTAAVHAAYVWGGSALVASQALKLLILQLW